MDKFGRLERPLAARRAPSFVDLMHVARKAADGDRRAVARLARLRPPEPYLAALHRVAFGSPD